MNPLHYPDIERCKKLTEIGFPFYTQTRWHINCEKLQEPPITSDEYHMMRDQDEEEAGEYSILGNYVCPSVMELLDVIPQRVKDGDDYALLEMYPSTLNEKKWFACYIDLGTGNKIDSSLDTMAESLPNALCDLVLWLHENKYITF